MHEMTVATEMIKIVEKSVPEGNLGNVTRINLLIGELSCIQEDCLTFAFKAITRGTPLEEAEVVIEKTSPRFRCKSCGEEFDTPGGLVSGCAGCGSYGPEIIQGDEMTVQSIEME